MFLLISPEVTHGYSSLGAQMGWDSPRWSHSSVSLICLTHLWTRIPQLLMWSLLRYNSGLLSMLRLLSSKEASPSKATPVFFSWFHVRCPIWPQYVTWPSPSVSVGKGCPKSYIPRHDSLETITVIIYSSYEERCIIYRLEVK